MNMYYNTNVKSVESSATIAAAVKLWAMSLFYLKVRQYNLRWTTTDDIFHHAITYLTKINQVYQAISFWSDLYFIYIEHLCIIYIYIEYFGPGALHNKPKSSYLHHCAW